MCNTVHVIDSDFYFAIWIKICWFFFRLRILIFLVNAVGMPQTGDVNLRKKEIFFLPHIIMFIMIILLWSRWTNIKCQISVVFWWIIWFLTILQILQFIKITVVKSQSNTYVFTHFWRMFYFFFFYSARALHKSRKISTSNTIWLFFLDTDMT